MGSCTMGSVVDTLVRFQVQEGVTQLVVLVKQDWTFIENKTNEKRVGVMMVRWG